MPIVPKIRAAAGKPGKRKSLRARLYHGEQGGCRGRSATHAIKKVKSVPVRQDQRTDALDEEGPSPVKTSSMEKDRGTWACRFIGRRTRYIVELENLVLRPNPPPHGEVGEMRSLQDKGGSGLREKGKGGMRAASEATMGNLLLLVCLVELAG